MRVIYIDPDQHLVEERDEELTLQRLQELVHGYIEGHWIVPHFLPGHDAFVDEEGIIKNRTVWLFGHVHIWGPMIIFGRNKSAKSEASASLERVRQLVNFDSPRYLSTGAKMPPL